MKVLKKNKVVLMFYIAIICFSMLWMWRVERLDKNINENNNGVILDIKY